MNKTPDQQRIQQSFYRINRFLLLTLLASIIGISVLFWLLGYASTDRHSIKIGLVLMGLAVIFYKLPHISYGLTKVRYRGDEAAQMVFQRGWREFRDSLPE